MIYKSKNTSEHIAFLFEGLRRLYYNSVDEFGRIGNYDYLYIIANKNSKGQIVIPFEDYYCPRLLQDEIINDLLNDSFLSEYNKKTRVRKIKKSDLRNNIKTSIYLGPSPNSSISGFTKYHPNFKNFLKNNPDYLKFIKPYLDKSELDEIDNIIKT